jgi:hypothetical protein
MAPSSAPALDLAPATSAVGCVGLPCTHLLWLSLALMGLACKDATDIPCRRRRSLNVVAGAGACRPRVVSTDEVNLARGAHMDTCMDINLLCGWAQGVAQDPRCMCIHDASRLGVLKGTATNGRPAVQPCCSISTNRRCAMHAAKAGQMPE